MKIKLQERKSQVIPSTSKCDQPITATTELGLPHTLLEEVNDASFDDLDKSFAQQSVADVSVGPHVAVGGFFTNNSGNDSVGCLCFASRHNTQTFLFLVRLNSGLRVPSVLQSHWLQEILRPAPIPAITFLLRLLRASLS